MGSAHFVVQSFLPKVLEQVAAELVELIVPAVRDGQPLRLAPDLHDVHREAAVLRLVREGDLDVPELERGGSVSLRSGTGPVAIVSAPGGRGAEAAQGRLLLRVPSATFALGILAEPVD